jgi:hypothetical protein
MKSWFAKMRLSAAPGEDPLAAVDAELRATAPKARVPAPLHRSIMRAVRSAERPAADLRRLVFLRWMAVPAGAALALLVVWHSLRHPASPQNQETQSFNAAAGALEMGGQIARAVPSAVVAPLSHELQGLNQDLDKAAQHLLASMP